MRLFVIPAHAGIQNLAMRGKFANAVIPAHAGIQRCAALLTGDSVQGSGDRKRLP